MAEFSSGLAADEALPPRLRRRSRNDIAHATAVAEEACHKCHFVLHFSTFAEQTAIRHEIRNHTELRQAPLRVPRIEESAWDNGQNGTLHWIRSKAVGHAHKPRRQISPGHAGEELLQQHIEYRRRSGRLLRISADDVATNGDGLRSITRWYHHVPADLRCAVTPVHQAADGSEDLAALGECSIMNTFHRILAYLFHGRPAGPWSWLALPEWSACRFPAASLGTPFNLSIRNPVTQDVRCNQLLCRRATGCSRRDGLGGDPCTRCGMVLVDARGGGTNRRAMGREIRQEAGRAGCAPCNAETGCCRVACRRTIHGWARSDRFGPACCQTLGRTEETPSSPHAGVLTINPKPTQLFDRP